MLARYAADTVVVIHFLFILFVIFGALPALRWPKLAWLHLPAAAWGAAIELGGFICPLTPLENRLRTAAGQQVYPVGFIEQYLLPVVYPAGLTRTTQIVFGIAVIALNVLFYTWLVARRRRRKPRP